MNNLLKHFQRSSPSKIIDIYGIATTDFPVYTIDGIYFDRPYETSGSSILDFRKKLINANVNFTEGNSIVLNLKYKMKQFDFLLI